MLLGCSSTEVITSQDMHEPDWSTVSTADWQLIASLPADSLKAGIIISSCIRNDLTTECYKCTNVWENSKAGLYKLNAPWFSGSGLVIIRSNTTSILNSFMKDTVWYNQ